MSLNELPDDQQVVIVVTAGQLKEFFGGVLPGAGSVATEKKASAEVNTAGAKKILTEKGYSVKVTASLTKKLEEHGVQSKKRGRDKWYLTSEVEAIPKKD